jgi:hypothetical protein
MYGVMSFRHNNSYSPRCGTSVTGCGRWSLNVSAAVVNGLGFEIIYGDTDSVMYAIDFQRPDVSLVRCYTSQMVASYINVSETDIKEFVAGNRSAFVCNDKHLIPICNIVMVFFVCYPQLVKVIYTITQQHTSSKCTNFP